MWIDLKRLVKNVVTRLRDKIVQCRARFYASIVERQSLNGSLQLSTALFYKSLTKTVAVDRYILSANNLFAYVLHFQPTNHGRNNLRQVEVKARPFQVSTQRGWR
jgi:hypothetical protein